MSIEGDKEFNHPSFGMVNISRASCTPSVTLFGSSIPHRSIICIEIHKAHLTRSLNQDSIFAGDRIIELEMSTTQFADAITNLNSQGTPCTITFAEGHSIQPCPFQNKRIQFDEEFEETLTEVGNETNESYTKIQAILAKDNIGKADRKEILKELAKFQATLSNSLPFVKKQFSEQMDRTVLEAKNDFSSYVDNELKRLGLEGFKDKLLKLGFLEQATAPKELPQK